MLLIPRRNLQHHPIKLFLPLLDLFYKIICHTTLIIEPISQIPIDFLHKKLQSVKIIPHQTSLQVFNGLVRTQLHTAPQSQCYPKLIVLRIHLVQLPDYILHLHRLVLVGYNVWLCLCVLGQLTASMLKRQYQQVTQMGRNLTQIYVQTVIR